jgi:hypothetical protein
MTIRRGRLACPLILSILLLAVSGCAIGQRADTSYRPEVPDPAFDPGSGPLVAIDRAHHNFHTLDGRYQAFGRLLTADGYRVANGPRQFIPGSLDEVDILVIANAVAEANVDNWDRPNHPAFTGEEVEMVKGWVAEGGSLWLIADHMPFPAAAEKLAAAFGFLFINGYAIDPEDSAPMRFRPEAATLREHRIVRGRSPEEAVGWVTSFTGQGFRLAPGAAADPIMVLAHGVEILMPERSWQFDDTTERIDGAGLLQGAVRRYERGRVAVFGEAAMFTAQVAGEGISVGLAHPSAPYNERFTLNIAHWLSGLLDEVPPLP